MNPDHPSVDRRGFLKRAAAASAAALAAPAAGAAAQPAAQRAAMPATPIMSASAETANPPEVDVLTTDRTGSDFMVDVLKSLGFDYICANPGSSFRGIHESVINYGGNKSPELICHNYEGHGGAAGARLAPNPLPFRAFVTYVRSPRGDMPPYTAKVMSEQDLADVHAYLRSRPRPAAVANIPLLAR